VNGKDIKLVKHIIGWPINFCSGGRGGKSRCRQLFFTLMFQLCCLETQKILVESKKVCLAVHTIVMTVLKRLCAIFW